MWDLLWRTLGQTLVIFIVGVATLKWLNDATVQLAVNRTGRSNHQIWWMQPGIFIHELWHASVAMIFGIRVKGLSMRADEAAGSAAHVTLNFKPHSIWQQTGMFLSATAPVWGNALVMSRLTQRAFLPTGFRLFLIGHGWRPR
ncbi:hypothetical protein [Lacticaseibacillus brantae]|uniref:Uncharacterized protein n=1 Tax=Lacticaseibacillus brantae DSM 23927 TaxID=1423727 RepID=A0A0R2AZB4_9LACO|nr:hypothetical protein [Lacticaseibacillus brantae]KRM72416.1 hypothetical protein FC34_GL000119 [Lacticaseibacillus brantae DSM 23927]